jgi:hypothetical protein
MTFGSAIPILALACLAVARAENPNRPAAKVPPPQTPKSERQAAAKPNKNDPNQPKRKDAKAQVRASVTKLQALPAPRHAIVQRQINQMRPMTDVDRSALMNSEEFRSKFTPAEQQIIADISLVTPQELTARKERPRPQ